MHNEQHFSALKFITCGSVDDGKSTLIGRLLVDTKAVLQDHLAGVVVSWYMYLINPAVPAAIGRALRPLVVILENKYFMDWFNENVLARGARALGNGLWKVGDRTLIDGLLVNGSWKLVGMVSAWTRKLQSGYLYHYALVMILGIFLLMTYFVWLNK